MLNKILALQAKIFLGKGIDKKFPFLVSLYKKVCFLVAKNGEGLVDIPLNSKLLVSEKDTGLGLFLRTKGEFEPIQTKLFLELIKPGNTFLDLGANIGYYSVLTSKVVGQNGKVFAFEPDPQNLNFLKKNVALNQANNVQIVEAAVGKTIRKQELRQDLSNPGESTLAQTKNGSKVKVKVTTLDKFLNQAQIKKTDVVKIDIEGAEIDALKGGQKFLQKAKNIKLFIECNQEALKQFNYRPTDLIKKLKEYGFEIKTIINEFEKKTYPFSLTELENNLKRVSFVSLYAEKNEKN